MNSYQRELGWSGIWLGDETGLERAITEVPLNRETLASTTIHLVISIGPTKIRRITRGNYHQGSVE